MVTAISAKDIILFWYSDRIRTHWFSSTPQLDSEIREKYEALWNSAASGALEFWISDPESCLALVMVLDQLPLNMFRGKAQSFQTEQQAVAVAKHAVDMGYDKIIDRNKLMFLFMSFMHSENSADQETAVQLYRQNNLEENAKFAEHHWEIVRKFGRFPHRNSILGRPSTDEEIAYLASEQAFKG